MFEQWLDIELLDNVVISADSATEGGHQSLDYLPGSVLLGAAAARLFKTLGPAVFLTGRLRFSPSLPLTANNDLAWPMPLSFHTFKEATSPCQLLNGLFFTETETRLWAQQGKSVRQLRGGAITADGQHVTILQNHSMKSATDRDRFDRSAESQLFGYQHLVRGQKFVSRLQADDAIGAQVFAQIIAVLTENGVRLGRCRSAEYSRVRVTKRPIPVILPAPAPTADNLLSFYLLSDLALFDQGAAHFLPRPADFGLPASACFLPEKSFMRTRRYSPWNSFRNCPDPERQVLCRGSVISFAAAKVPQEQIAARLATGVGAYRQEGLGWLLCNPDFLVNAPAQINDAMPQPTATKAATAPPESAASKRLMHYVLFRQAGEQVSQAALRLGLAWANQWWEVHQDLSHTDSNAADQGRKPPGKSQWAKIRELACKAGDDPGRLSQELEDYCLRARRQQGWSATVRKGRIEYSMADKVLATLAPASIAKAHEQAQLPKELGGRLVISALYHAACEMGRKIGRKRS